MLSRESIEVLLLKFLLLANLNWALKSDVSAAKICLLKNIRVSQLGSTGGGHFGQKWPKTPLKWQNQYFLIKIVEEGGQAKYRGRIRKIFVLGGGYPPVPPLEETLNILIQSLQI